MGRVLGSPLLASQKKVRSSVSCSAGSNSGIADCRSVASCVWSVFHMSLIAWKYSPFQKPWTFIAPRSSFKAMEPQSSIGL